LDVVTDIGDYSLDNGFGGGYVAALICAVAAKGEKGD